MRWLIPVPDTRESLGYTRREAEDGDEGGPEKVWMAGATWREGEGESKRCDGGKGEEAPGLLGTSGEIGVCLRR